MNENPSAKGWEVKKQRRQIIGEEIMELAIKCNSGDGCLLRTPAEGTYSSELTLRLKVPNLESWIL